MSWIPPTTFPPALTEVLGVTLTIQLPFVLSYFFLDLFKLFFEFFISHAVKHDTLSGSHKSYLPSLLALILSSLIMPRGACSYVDMSLRRCWCSLLSLGC